MGEESDRAVTEAAEAEIRMLVERMFALAGSEGAGDPASILHPEVSIHTSSGTIEGIDSATEWSGKRFDHLDRRYRPLEIIPTPTGAIVKAALEYVWRESGEVADSQEVEVEVGVRDGRISSWRLIDG